MICGTVMESLGAPLGGHICPTDNHSPAGHAQDGSSPSAPVDQVQEAMLVWSFPTPTPLTTNFMCFEPALMLLPYRTTLELLD